jgi:hypothetical protein
LKTLQLLKHPERGVVGGEHANGQSGFDARQGQGLSAGKIFFVGFVFGKNPGSSLVAEIARYNGVSFPPSVQASSGTIFCIRLTAFFQILSSKYLLIRNSAVYILNYVQGR